MKLENMMTRVMITKDINTPIWEVSRIMDEYDIGFVPITNEKKMVGVITDRDICCRCCKENVDLQKSIQDFMTKEVITIAIDANINDALNTFAKYKIKRLLVKDDNQIVGILTLSDIVNHCSYISDIIPTLQTIWQIDKNIQEKNNSIQTFEL